jgi:hypothetical protein
MSSSTQLSCDGDGNGNGEENDDADSPGGGYDQSGATETIRDGIDPRGEIEFCRRKSSSESALGIK